MVSLNGRKSSRDSLLRVIDLFSGCGGMSLGFHRAGYRVLGGVESDRHAAETHGLNFFGHESPKALAVHSHPRDITKFGPDAFLRTILGSTDPVDKVDVIIGGPPCQAFARIGRAKLREILQHPVAHLRDKRANLYLQYLKYVEYFRPKAVVMENVPDILNFGGKNVAESIASSLEDMGYRARYSILNAVHYGVPEFRQRFFLIAFRNDLGAVPTFPRPTHAIDIPVGYESAQRSALRSLDCCRNDLVRYVPSPRQTPGLPHSVTAREAIGDLPELTDHLHGRSPRGPRRFNVLMEYASDEPLSDYASLMRTWPGFAESQGVPDHVTRNLPRDYEIFRKMKPGDEYPEAQRLAMRLFSSRLEKLENEIGHRLRANSREYLELRKATVPPYDPGKFNNKWCKIDPERPVRTLTAHIGKDTYSHIHFDSRQARTISVREAARLQSFPDGFRFAGAMNAAFRQIGNAVPPLQAYAIARHLREELQTLMRSTSGKVADKQR